MNDTKNKPEYISGKIQKKLKLHLYNMKLLYNKMKYKGNIINKLFIKTNVENFDISS